MRQDDFIQCIAMYNCYIHAYQHDDKFRYGKADLAFSVLVGMHTLLLSA